MAIPKEANKLLNERISLIDKTVDEFRVEDIEKDVFEKLKRYLQKELDYDSNGKIRATKKNLKTIRNIKKLRPILLNDNYKAMVGKYVATFNEVRSLSDEYIRKI